MIVQNFRAKPDTAMRSVDDADRDEFLAAIAVARLVLVPRVAVQAPPNLVDRADVLALVGAGVDDLGGISPLTPDHVNPERPWPHLDELTADLAASGWTLRERLTAHPRYVAGGDAWIDPRVAGHVRALADPASGLAAVGTADHNDDDIVRPTGLPWQEPDDDWDSTGRTDLHTAIDSEGRNTDTRSDIGEAFGNWDVIRARAAEVGAAR